MNCREFEETWDDLLDARSEGSSHLERGLEAHASSCSRCRDVSSRYQLLRQAVASLRPPTPSAGSIERLYALTVPANPPTIPFRAPRARHRFRRPLIAAASFALAWLGTGGWPSTGPTDRAIPGLKTVDVPRRPLGLALADATEATLGLAREASAPASRIGREMFALGEPSAPERTTTSAPALAGESVDESGSADETASGLLKAVGDRVGAGVGPISGSARHAFSFLLGPAGEPIPSVPRKINSL